MLQPRAICAFFLQQALAASVASRRSPQPLRCTIICEASLSVLRVHPTSVCITDRGCSAPSGRSCGAERLILCLSLSDFPPSVLTGRQRDGEPAATWNHLTCACFCVHVQAASDCAHLHFHICARCKSTNRQTTQNIKRKVSVFRFSRRSEETLW